MKLRSLAIGLSLVTAGTIIGVSTQQFASADISTGDRPVLVPIEPCRLVDTRPGDATVGPRSSPLGAADILIVDAQEPATACTGMIPTEALSLSLNVTAIGATEQTFLTIWASGARPDASSLNPAPGAPPAPNAVTVDLSAAQEFEVYNNLGAVNLIVDINGYYENHNHDDLYYTKEESRAGFQPRIQYIDYDGFTSRPFATTIPAVKMRDLGTFESSGGRVEITWSSTVGGNGAACNFEIRVDGEPSRAIGSIGVGPNAAVINGDISSAPVTTIDLFEGLASGDHTVELWYRSVSSSCFENSGNYQRSVMVRETTAL